MTNLVAARVGRPPVMRRSVLTLFSGRMPEVGVPGENTALNQPGLVLTGFVERVGDPVPLIAEDGSAHRGEAVLAEALDAMTRTVGGGAPVAIAVPAYWGPAVIGALRGAMRDRPSLAPGGVPAALVPSVPHSPRCRWRPDCREAVSSPSLTWVAAERVSRSRTRV